MFLCGLFLFLCMCGECCVYSTTVHLQTYTTLVPKIKSSNNQKEKQVYSTIFIIWIALHLIRTCYNLGFWKHIGGKREPGLETVLVFKMNVCIQMLLCYKNKFSLNNCTDQVYFFKFFKHLTIKSRKIKFLGPCGTALETRKNTICMLCYIISPS